MNPDVLIASQRLENPQPYLLAHFQRVLQERCSEYEAGRPSYRFNSNIYDRPAARC